MAQHTQVAGKTARRMDLAYKNGQMAPNLKDSGKKIKHADEEG